MNQSFLAKSAEKLCFLWNKLILMKSADFQKISVNFGTEQPLWQEQQIFDIFFYDSGKFDVNIQILLNNGASTS